MSNTHRCQHMSVFVDVPVRYIDPQQNKNAVGFGDMILGFKYAFIAQPDAFYTFQFKTYVPTGAGELGLGTNHPSLEPGLLAFQRLSERLYFVGEFRDWIPVHGTNSVTFPNKQFAGNVLNYGLGAFYNVVLTDNFRVAPISEFVGWTALGGLETTQAARPVGLGRHHRQHENRSAFRPRRLQPPRRRQSVERPAEPLCRLRAGLDRGLLVQGHASTRDDLVLLRNRRGLSPGRFCC